MALNSALLERSQEEAVRQQDEEAKTGGRRARRFRCSHCPPQHPGYYTFEELLRHKKEAGH